MTRVRTGFAVAAVACIGIWAGSVAAEPALMKQAKEAGLPAQNCQYCHVSKLPKKDTFKPEDLNERGKWLMSQKDKRNAPKIDAGWLKEYPGGSAQK